MDDTNRLPLTDLEKEMIDICARVLDVDVTEVDVGWTDGTTQIVALNGNMMAIPIHDPRKAVDWVAVPFEQGVSQRQLGYAAKAHRTSNSLTMGAMVMLAMMEHDRMLAGGKMVGLSERLGLVELLPGSFTMGSPGFEPGHWDGEAQHRVVIARPFLICTTPVTQAIWKKVMGSNPSQLEGAHLPVDTVSWFDAVDFCNRLSELDGYRPAYVVRGEDVEWDRAANGYRLPTEAEWEYACRGGTTTPYYTGRGEYALDRAGWYGENSRGSTHPVGQKERNPWGLYDMHGNVLEWCWDWYGQYPSGTVTDPTGPSDGGVRVCRGGYSNSTAPGCRSAFRDFCNPAGPCSDNGLRPVRSVSQAPPQKHGHVERR